MKTYQPQHAANGGTTWIQGLHEYHYQQYMWETIGYPRSMMPQLDGHWLDMLRIQFGAGDMIRRDKLRLSAMRPTQQTLSEVEVKRLLDVGDNRAWRDRLYVVANDCHIIDGHHAWAAGLQIEPDYEVDVYIINLPIREALMQVDFYALGTKGDAENRQINVLKAWAENFDFSFSDLEKGVNPYHTPYANDISKALTEDGLWKGVSKPPAIPSGGTTGARGLPIGTEREWGGRNYVKTESGWVPRGKGGDKRGMDDPAKKKIKIKKMNKGVRHLLTPWAVPWKPGSTRGVRG